MHPTALKLLLALFCSFFIYINTYASEDEFPWLKMTFSNLKDLTTQQMEAEGDDGTLEESKNPSTGEITLTLRGDSYSGFINPENGHFVKNKPSFIPWNKTRNKLNGKVLNEYFEGYDPKEEEITLKVNGDFFVGKFILEKKSGQRLFQFYPWNKTRVELHLDALKRQNDFEVIENEFENKGIITFKVNKKIYVGKFAKTDDGRQEIFQDDPFDNDPPYKKIPFEALEESLLESGFQVKHDKRTQNAELQINDDTYRGIAREEMTETGTILIYRNDPSQTTTAPEFQVEEEKKSEEEEEEKAEEAAPPAQKPLIAAQKAKISWEHIKELIDRNEEIDLDDETLKWLKRKLNKLKIPVTITDPEARTINFQIGKKNYIGNLERFIIMNPQDAEEIVNKLVENRSCLSRCAGRCLPSCKTILLIGSSSLAFGSVVWAIVIAQGWTKGGDIPTEMYVAVGLLVAGIASGSLTLCTLQAQ